MWKNGNLDELKKLYGSQRRILDYSFFKYYFFDSHYAPSPVVRKYVCVVNIKVHFYIPKYVYEGKI